MEYLMIHATGPRQGPALIVFAVLTAGCVSARPNLAPTPETKPGRTVVVTANPAYRASGLHTVLFGGGYRDVWTTPVRVEVLDLASFAGGLTPEKKGGGMQTRSLHFEAGDGREFRIRSVDKDPSPTVPKMLRGTFAESIIQDQMSSAHPAGSLVVQPLEQAAGLLNRPRRMVVIPDDPRLGEFRKEFAGMLGILEEKPSTDPPVTPGFENVEDIEDWEELEPLLTRGEARIDARAFLRARLLDMLIGDWDRHPGQWEWAKVRGQELWQPVPTDRDQAFARFDGLVVKAVRFTRPQLVTFESDYPSVIGLAWNSREVDRRLLGELDWADYEAIARELQRALDDGVVEKAAQRMPPEYMRVSGESLARRLKARRDNLVEMARAFYGLLAEEAEIHGTDLVETVEVVRGEADGEVQLRAFRDNPGHGAPLFTRTFRGDDTDEIRVYLGGGNDLLRTVGDDDHGIELRVVGGPGTDTADDSRGGHTLFYDHEGETTLLRGPGTEESNKPYTHPRDERGYPMRDWGRSTMPMPVVAGGGDLGLLLGLELRHYDYGFRRIPWSSEQVLRVAYATAQRGVRVEYDGDFQYTNSRKRRRIFARYSNVELVRFHGFGNDTGQGSSAFHRTNLHQWMLRPAFRFGFDAPVDFSVGAVAKYTQPQLEPNRFLTLTRPYGSEDFGQVGLGTELVVDGRDVPRNATKGVLFELGGNVYPKAWDVKETFGEAHGSLATFLTPASPVTVALRAGGKKLWGRHPFHEAAFLGGPDTLRGLRRQRYAGDAAVYGNAELRLRMFEAKLFVPLELGVFGLVDGGRVFYGPEDSDTWHHAVGGGLALSFVKPANTVTLTWARSEGDVRVYFQGGFAF